MRKATLNVLNANGLVEVVVPLATSRSWVERMLRQHHDWLLEQQQRLQHAQINTHFLDGKVIPFLGRAYTLELCENLKGIIRIEEVPDSRRLRMYYDETSATVEELKEALNFFYGQELNQLIGPYLDKWHSAVGLTGVTWQIKLLKRYLTTRTVSTKRVTLSVNLAHLNPKFIDYTILYELAALLHPDLGAGFEEVMDHHMADWRSRIKYLDPFYDESLSN